jgi:hypothetical protein
MALPYHTQVRKRSRVPCSRRSADVGMAWSRREGLINSASAVLRLMGGRFARPLGCGGGRSSPGARPLAFILPARWAWRGEVLLRRGIVWCDSRRKSATVGVSLREAHSERRIALRQRGRSMLTRTLRRTQGRLGAWHARRSDGSRRGLGVGARASWLRWGVVWSDSRSEVG